MKTYHVMSQEYGTVVPVLDDGSGPLEYGRDYVCVKARSRRDAVMLAVKHILTTWPGSVAHDNRSDGLPPWAGYRAYAPGEVAA